MKTAHNILKNMSKKKHSQLQRDWKSHNKRLKQEHRHNEQFSTFEDYVLYRHGMQTSSPRSFKELKTNHYPSARRQTQTIPSITDVSNSNSTFRREPHKYSGTYVKGIATMHKSNLIPITSNEQAVDVSRMRRG